MDHIIPRIRIRVPELLEERGWTPMELVRRAGLAMGTAYRLANGEAKGVTFDVLEKLCATFGVDVGELFEIQTPVGFEERVTKGA